MDKMKDKEITYLKINKGHKIWIKKGIKNGWKFFGIYQREVYAM